MAAKIPHEVQVTRRILLEAQENPRSHNLDAAHFEYQAACIKHGLDPDDYLTGEHPFRTGVPIRTGLAEKILKLWRK